MRNYILFCLTIILFASSRACGQDDYNERAKNYIRLYYNLAVAEQRRSGVPASITLGQGILETEAGSSELMTQANNHFGIKCKNGWTGETYLHTDDAPNECFKKYGCAADSYKDHSDHLKRNQRYAPLFRLAQTDYASWAKCLKKCGYATNPQYAQQLIKIIEDFRLQEYTYAALNKTDADNSNLTLNDDYKVMPVVYSTPIPDTNRKVTLAQDTVLPAKPQEPVSTIAQIADSARNIMAPKEEPIAATAPKTTAVDTPGVTTVNGLKAFYARKGETLYSYAEKYVISYPFLLQINDLRNEPLPFDTYIYLERKHTTGLKETHTVTEGETTLMIAQQEGMQLRSLCALNKLNPTEEPVTGAVLQLQKPGAEKPQTKPRELAAHSGNAIISKDDSGNRQKGDYLTINRSRPQTKPAEVAAVPEKLDTPRESGNAVVLPLLNDAAPAAIVKPVHKEVSEMTYEEIEAETAKKAEFAKLKAQLDPIVYADDSRLAAQTGGAIAALPEKTATPEPARTSNANSRYYTVKKGDTAFSIAKKNNISLEQLYKWNNIEAGDIKAGKTLQVKE